MGEKVQYTGLELIRFPASIIVLIYHYPIVFGGIALGSKNFILSLIYDYGYYCVEIFFAISGFVIFLAHGNKLRSFEKGYLFIFGRIIRIYPLMLLTTVCAAICQWITILYLPNGRLITEDWAFGAWHSTLTGFVLSLFGLQSGWISNLDYAAVVGASWYVSVLMICYMIFAFVIKYCKGNRVKENAYFFFITMLGIYIYIYDLKFPLMYWSCGRGYLNFFLGVFLAEIVENIRQKGQKLFLVSISWGAIALFVLYANLQLEGRNCLGHVGVAVSIVLVPSLLLIFSCSEVVKKFSNNKFLLYLGRISFGIYLWHIPIVMWVYLFQDIFGLEFAPDNPQSLFLIIVLTCFVSIISYELYEKPITIHGKNKLAIIENSLKSGN